MEVRYKYLNTILKLIFFIGLSIALYRRVFTNEDFHGAIFALKENLIHGRGFFVIAVLLSFLNWSVESVKWKSLVTKLTPISFGKSFLGILFGIAFSLFTPNRLGEYGGRVLVLKDHKIAAIVSTLIGSYSQIVVNMTIGGIAGFIYLWKYVHLSPYLLFTVSIFFLIWMVFLFVSFFNIEIVSVLFRKYSFFKKIAEYVDVVKLYQFHELRNLLFLSFFRYSIYCLQFFLLLKVFRVGIHFFEGIVLIPSVFFLQSILPTMAIFDLSLRGQIAVEIIGTYAKGGLVVVVAASTVLWFINLIVPSIIGGVVALFYKFNR
ncbi:MAG: flippase-like domain-containing protein [Chitinophagales bacterium]|nr:flippase-like domain-containing protein [Chitinophagales bacterium]